MDLAKRVFQLHGATMTGHVRFRKKLTREQFRRFMAEHPPCMVVFEACGSASYWAREMAAITDVETVNRETAAQYQERTDGLDFLCGYRKECVWEGEAIRYLGDNRIGWGALAPSVQLF